MHGDDNRSNSRDNSLTGWCIEPQDRAQRITGKSVQLAFPYLLVIAKIHCRQRRPVNFKQAQIVFFINGNRTGRADRAWFPLTGKDGYIFELILCQFFRNNVGIGNHMKAVGHHKTGTSKDIRGTASFLNGSHADDTGFNPCNRIHKRLVARTRPHRTTD